MGYDLIKLTKQANPRKRVVRMRINKVKLSQEAGLVVIYESLVKEWHKQIKRLIIPAYKSAIADIIKDDWLDDISAALIEAGAAMFAFGAMLRPSVSQWALLTGQQTTTSWILIVREGTGVDNAILIDKTKVNAIAEASALENHQQLNGLSENMRTRISQIVWAGLRERKTEKQIALELSNALNITLSKARNLAKDQAHKLNRAIDRYLQEEANLNQYIWRHTPQMHPRVHHVARDFRLFRWDTPPYDGPPGTQPHCKCYTQAYVPLA